jgi:DNA-binding MarR family transcriptional regulator
MDDPQGLEIDNSDDRLLPLRVWLALFSSVKQIEALVRTNLRETFSSTLPRFDLLSQLYRSPGGLTMGEMSARLMVTNGNVTGLIARLVGEGLVDRLQDADDRRVQRVRLTPKGRRVFSNMAPANQTWVTAAMAEMDEGELRQLQALLAKLKASAAGAMARMHGDEAQSLDADESAD